MSSVDFLLGALRLHAEGFCALAATADPTRPVPSCAPWSAADLIAHLGATEEWAESIVRTGRGGPEHTPPTDGLVDFQRAAADRLLATLEQVDPDAEVWTLTGAGTARFWIRRQAHEHAVHHWDLADSQGIDLELDPELAADGIDEIVTMFLPRQIALDRIAAPTRTVELCTTDTDHRWRIGPGDAPEAHLETTAGALHLALWGRRPLPADALVTGDPTAIEDLLATALVP